MWKLATLMVLVAWRVVNSQKDLLPRDSPPDCQSDLVVSEVGSKLILTPYLECNYTREAREISAVTGGPFPEDVPSYSGFFTVNKTYNSNLFFWFFPAEESYETAPLLLWLQGGPGASSLYGLFTELGPFSVAENMTLLENPYSWHKNHSIIFIDNPVGTGFSFTDHDSGYATDQVQVGNELYIAIIQFLTMFPELQEVPFFIAGESYGGKHAPALGYTIHQRNPTATLKINLEGLAVGNGFTDPITLFHYSDFAYQLGFVDTKVFNMMKKAENSAVKAIQENRLLDAFKTWTSIMGIFPKISQQHNIYNFLYSENADTDRYFLSFIQEGHVRRHLHVGDVKFSDENTVFKKMEPDFMNSVRHWLEVLLDNYRVMYFSGQMDIIVAYPLSVQMYNKLEFNAAEEYRNAKRVPWYVDGELAGYMKSGGNFTEVLVRNAGHMVSMDQPKWAFDLINRFTSNNLLTPEN